MTVVYVPVYKMAISYTVSFGRRWSLLEHMILVELAKEKRTVFNLTQLCDLPERLIIEALINLLRAGWIEIRAADDLVAFAATAVGTRRATEGELPVTLQKKVKWITLCAERLTGSWLREDDLQLVHENDLPPNATQIEPVLSTYDTNDGTVRDLLYLDHDESFEHFEPNFRAPSRLLARFEVAFDRVVGLPPYAPLSLERAIRDRAPVDSGEVQARPQGISGAIEVAIARDTLGADDIIVGGAEHLKLLRSCLSDARTNFILHSCFLDPKAIESLLPDFAAAAKRGVYVDLLWGLRSDPEDINSLHPLVHCEQALDKVGADARARIRLSAISSGSHAKCIVYNSAKTQRWEAVVGSCNFLSSYYDLIEISLRSRSNQLVALVLGRLIAAQQPPSGGWSPIARRLAGAWDELRRQRKSTEEDGTHRLNLLADDDHYACVTTARDQAERSIAIGCDLYGLAAETSVLVPMERAVELGRKVRLYYRRPSKYLTQEGRTADEAGAMSRGLSLSKVAKLHGKFLMWDDSALAISSFNWLATVVGTRARGAELGVLALGPNLRSILAEKLNQASNDEIIEAALEN